MKARTLRAMALLAPLSMPLGGCATSETGLHGWRSEPAETVFSGQRPPNRVRVALEDTAVVLEGARLESDSLIGFQEVENGRWERVTIPARTWERLEVRKIDPALVVLLAALVVLPMAAGGS